jgi:hypothetical protein
VDASLLGALIGLLGPPDDARGDTEFRSDGVILCADSIASLGAFLRSEELPEQPSEAERVINRWPEGVVHADSC